MRRACSAAAAFAALRIVRPLVSRVNGLYAAKTIEEADPAFKNSLINYLDLRRHRDELPKAVAGGRSRRRRSTT